MLDRRVFNPLFDRGGHSYFFYLIGANKMNNNFENKEKENENYTLDFEFLKSLCRDEIPAMKPWRVLFLETVPILIERIERSIELQENTEPEGSLLLTEKEKAYIYEIAAKRLPQFSSFQKYDDCPEHIKNFITTILCLAIKYDRDREQLKRNTTEAIIERAKQAGSKIVCWHCGAEDSHHHKIGCPTQDSILNDPDFDMNTL